MAPSDPTALSSTQTLGLLGGKQPPGSVRQFSFTVVEGPHVGQVWRSSSDRCSIGSHSLNDLVIEDPTVSRFHCEIRLEPAGATVFDLNSRNGTILDGVVVKEALLRGGSLLRMGKAVLRFQFATESNRLPLSELERFGSLVGRSVPMRTTFSWLERAAKSDVTVLLEGETGTGKGAAARAIHDASARKAGPFVVVDCGAIPVNLLESELFGHEKGSFTGADVRRIGAFEDADGGTIFLDEIGELPADLQPKLLRVLESKEYRRVGSNAFRPVNVRIIAATNRDLRAEVNAGRFRADLFFRLAVVKVPLPPLRQRPEDLPFIVREILAGLGASDEQTAEILRPEFMQNLERAAWPGNVRELRNFLERSLVFPESANQDDQPLATPAGTGSPAPTFDNLPYAEARKQALADFERRYVEALLARHHGKVGTAAEAADIDRVYLYKLIKKHRLEKK